MSNEQTAKCYGIFIEMESTYEPSEWESSDICAGLKAIPGCIEAVKHPTKPTTVVSVHEIADCEYNYVGGLHAPTLARKHKTNELLLELPPLKSGQRYVLRELQE